MAPASARNRAKCSSAFLSAADMQALANGDFQTMRMIIAGHSKWNAQRMQLEIRIWAFQNGGRPEIIPIHYNALPGEQY